MWKLGLLIASLLLWKESCPGLVAGLYSLQKAR